MSFFKKFFKLIAKVLAVVMIVMFIIAALLALSVIAPASGLLLGMGPWAWVGLAVLTGVVGATISPEGFKEITNKAAEGAKTVVAAVGNVATGVISSAVTTATTSFFSNPLVLGFGAYVLYAWYSKKSDDNDDDNDSETTVIRSRSSDNGGLLV
jgi:Mn2+/Fe2+ NRAMP family transporter